LEISQVKASGRTQQYFSSKIRNIHARQSLLISPGTSPKAQGELNLPRQGEFEQSNLPPGPDLPNKTPLRPDEVASLFSVSHKTVYTWIECGKLTAC
jgi:hypothetical protein